ncbi:hypothetical protein N3K66_007506 [Trichothecium roseum]|uniref:Uncharacterized protein n=1 Tax=Trichothecium roseum TaxID=47278 RepID=A0ACC0UU46_9HYPO|nr:hypothetical protein N3K66_007506 [Trichothecium roseum]
MAASSTRHVPFAYTFFFSNLDPLVALYGVYLNFAAPETAVSSVAPGSAYDPRQAFLFHQAGGLALAVSVFSAALPRLSADLSVWRAFQFALLLSDFAGLSGMYFSLESQGRLRPADWTGDDVGAGGSYAFLTVLRLAFLLGVGFAKPSSNKDR